MMPLLPFYAQHLGATPVEVGLMISIYAFFQLLSGPPLGSLSDRIGRKPVLLASQIGTFAGFLLLGFAQNIWMAYASRVLDGVTAGNITVAQAYISDVTKPSERTKSFALLGIAFGIGFLIGPAATGLIAQNFGEHAAVFTAAGLSFTSILATVFLLPANPPRPEPDADAVVAPPAAKKLSVLDWGSYAQYFRRPALAPLFWQFAAYSLGFALFSGGFGLFAERRLTYEGKPFGTREVGFVLAYAGFLGIFVQGGLGRVMRTVAESRLILLGFLAEVLGLAILAFTTNIPMLGLATTTLALSGVLRPIISSGLSRRARPSEQGVVIGLTQSITSVSQIVGPALAGVLIGANMLHMWGLAAAGLSAIGLVFWMKDVAKVPERSSGD
ncbi:tetracycline resistance MFS efflux pump [Bryobacterales bacterium F-183]|nr:tetracycline resistance MFS efflux pump [Bryobacterales bacterium F-183]